MTKECTSFFLNDDPANKDEFESHERVADAIYELIKIEKNSKTIALTGQWGSGKSTIVSIINDKVLAEEPDIKIMEFDAWEHEGNSLRRSFLESLMDNLEKTKWSKAEQWIPTRNRISRKLKETETRSLPTLTKEGRNFIIATAFSTIGIMGLNKLSFATQNRLGLTWQVIPYISPNFVPYLVALLVLCALSPILLFLIYLLKPKDKNNKMNILSLFLNKVETVTKTETFENPEPTSIEFQIEFNKILGTVLSKYPKRKLVVVIDNLDRLSADDLLKTWSTMRTFLDATTKEEWKNRFWLILPFDKIALENTLHKNSDNTLKSKTQLFVNSLIDKTVQIKFDVPPPALSKWKNYMEKLLQNEVLPNHKNTDDFHDVYQVFLLYFVKESGDELITPRKIKLFLNQIAVIHRIWEDTIPLADQAFYVAMGLLDIDVYKELLKEEKMSVLYRYSYLLSDEFFNNMAALYLNVGKEDALQIIMGPRITAALLMGERKELKQLIGTHGFYDVLERVVLEEQESFVKDPTSLVKTAYTLSEIPASVENLKGINKVWRTLLAGVNNKTDWYIASKRAGIGYTELLKKANLEAKKNMLSHINMIEDFEDSSVDEWLQGISYVISYLENNDYLDLIRSIPNPINETSIFEFVGALKDTGLLNTMKLLSSYSIDPLKVKNELINRISNGSATAKEEIVLKRLYSISLVSPDNEIIQTINNRILQLGTSVQSSNELNTLLSLHLALLRIMSYPSDIIQETKSNLDSYLFNFYSFSNQHALIELEGTILCLILISNPALSLRQHSGNSSNGVNLIQNLIDYPHHNTHIVEPMIEEFKNNVDIEIAFSRQGIEGYSSQLAEIVLREIIKDKTYYYKNLNCNHIVKYYHLLDKASGGEIHDLLLHFVGQDEFINSLITSNFMPENSGLYRKVILMVEDISRNIVFDWIATNLKKLSNEFWRITLTEKDSFYDFFTDFINLHSNFTLGVDYADLIYMLVTDKLDEYKDDIIKLFSVVDDSHKESVILKIRRHINQSDNSVKDILKVFHGVIFEHVTEISKDYINELINVGFTKILQREDTKEIVEMANLFKMKPEIYKQGDPGIWNTFVDRVQNYQDINEENKVLQEAYEEVFSSVKKVSKGKRKSVQPST
ncbi:P-loop NTPase fold protein [Paenibacillus donghaensis]|uniref:KAP NTPase domain-containing protein n=1 Tax=Paenibacillus donghaensis TaxID=414771 RepID=A0A2Z2KRX9_9BACL|nr:P-loop NTPase fold protein [Paenibacillus donghaensis]ASA24272.1 hypothetical protein B9T62_28030 [Paenibacillus donghaensis]